MTNTAGAVYAEAPWNIPPRAWLSILKRTYSAFFINHISMLAAAVAFYAYLSFVPMLAAVVMIYGLVGDPDLVSEHMRTITGLVPGDTARLINAQMLSLVSEAKSQTGFRLAIALLLAIYGATRASSATIEALNVVYCEKEARGWFDFYRVSFGITVTIVLIVITGVAAALILGLLENFAKDIGPETAFVLKLVTWLAAGVVAGFIFALIYRFAPNRRHARWQWLTAGTVTATLIWLLATLAMSVYLSRVGGYNETYGSLGAVVVFLLWLFVSALVMLMGAQINAEAERQTLADTTVGPEMPPGTRGAKVADEVVSE